MNVSKDAYFTQIEGGWYLVDGESRTYFDAEYLIDYIGGKYNCPFPEFLRDELTEGQAHWKERGWGYALPQYSDSLKVIYKDSAGENGDIVRYNTFISYIKENNQADDLPLIGARKLDGLFESPDVGAPFSPSILLNRYTARKFSGKVIDLRILTSIISSALGSIYRLRKYTRDSSDPRRFSSSFGSSFEIAICIYNVCGIENAIYFIDFKEGCLVQTRKGDYRTDVCDVIQKQTPPLSGNATFIIVADFYKWQWRYRHEKALRNLFIEAGRVAQDIIISSERHGLKAFPTPAISDSLCDELLDVPPARFNAIYTITIGRVDREYLQAE